MELDWLTSKLQDAACLCPLVLTLQTQASAPASVDVGGLNLGAHGVWQILFQLTISLALARIFFVTKTCNLRKV